MTFSSIAPSFASRASRPPAVPMLVVFMMLVTGEVSGQPVRAASRNPLSDATASIETLVARVSRSVVQVSVTGYQAPRDPSRTGLPTGRSHTLGSGVVIDAGGYILTNAHVVSGAERIQVTLPGAEPAAGPPRLADMQRRSVEARLVGIAAELDLALIAVDVAGLEPLPLADYSQLRQGELVFAFGSPDGLPNSVTMGMVSAVARQTEDLTALVYVQTDAAINPGSSGGPLVNVRGELVGINTFIRSVSGGSDGLGFALPSAFVAMAWPQLRDFGHLHRAVVGLAVQTVTPLLGEGLSLPLDARLIVADVAPGSPAAGAGLEPGDVITGIDGRAAADLSLAELYLTLYTLAPGQRLILSSRRGDPSRIVALSAVEVPHICERATVIDSQGTLIEPLGVLGVPISDTDRSARGPGVLVALRVDAERIAAGVLACGDVILAVNGVAVTSPSALRAELARVPTHGAIVLQVAREGQLTFVAVEREAD